MLQFYLSGKKKLDDAMAQSLGVILLALTSQQLDDINWTSDDITAAVGKVDSGADTAMVQHTTYSALIQLSSYNIFNYRLKSVSPCRLELSYSISSLFESLTMLRQNKPYVFFGHLECFSVCSTLRSTTLGARKIK